MSTAWQVPQLTSDRVLQQLLKQRLDAGYGREIAVLIIIQVKQHSKCFGIRRDYYDMSTGGQYPLCL